jgi:hypothetical protein
LAHKGWTLPNLQLAGLHRLNTRSVLVLRLPEANSKLVCMPAEQDRQRLPGYARAWTALRTVKPRRSIASFKHSALGQLDHA